MLYTPCHCRQQSEGPARVMGLMLQWQNMKRDSVGDLLACDGVDYYPTDKLTDTRVFHK